MYSRAMDSSAMRFWVRPERKLAEVLLVGDFTHWRPLAMSRLSDGCFETVVPLSPGRYQYKFIMDGQWVKDPDNNNWALGGDGTLASVVAVGSADDD